MAEQYLEFTIEKQAQSNEIIIAAMADLPIESFWEDEDLKFYMARTSFNRQVESELNDLAQKWNFIYSFKVLADINWNERWEAGFKPVDVGSFCRVRASFHDSQPGFEHEIIVDPKMAFGTGHHATTYMMIQHMAKLDIQGRKVLDYGTGTGILAILAHKLGARSVFANDIESKAIENAQANAKINETANIHFEIGDITSIPEGEYDVILANINRNVLVESLARLTVLLSVSGHLVMSGILLQDEEIMRRHFIKNSLEVTHTEKMDDWLSFVCHN